MSADARFVHELLLRAAARPDAVALIHRGETTSYSTLGARAGEVGRWLGDAGLVAGERVAIMVPDPVSYVACLMGSLSAGCVAVPLNPQTTDRALRSVLDDCGASCLLGGQGAARHVEAVAGDVASLRVAATLDGDAFRIAHAGAGRAATNGGAAARDADDAALILYTSGTTGEPKGVTLSHANLLANTGSIVQYLELTADDRVMAVLPFFYSYGNSLLLTHLAVGGSLVVNQSFLYPNVILDEMQTHEVTGFSGVPSTFAILLNRSSLRERAFPRLRYLTQAGGPMPPSTVDRLREILPDVRIFLMYGQTEASARLSYLPPDDLLRKPGSIGIPIPGVTLQVLDEHGREVGPGEVGEIVARGPNVMRGYWGRPDATAQVLRDGRLWTGDLGRRDEDGYLYVQGRRTDMIKSAAHRIAPREIEEVLLEHPAVLEVAVLGVPDELLGEAIRACVILDPAVPCTEHDLAGHCKTQLPPFKVPQEFQFVDELPKTQSGKVKKALLRE